MHTFRFSVVLLFAATLLLSGCGRAASRAFAHCEGAGFRAASRVFSETAEQAGRVPSRVARSAPAVHSQPEPPHSDGSSLGETVTEQAVDLATEAVSSDSDDSSENQRRP